MKKIIIVLVFTIPVLTQAQEPLFKKEYKPQIDLSLIGGIQNNQNFDASAPVYGVEISLQCPLITTKKNYIRQQFSLIRQEGKMLKTLAVEINPQYQIIAKPSFELGVGPSAGLIFANVREDHKPTFDYGLGASAVYHFNKFFIGFESRWALTKKISLVDSNKESILFGNLNNLRTFFKFGYKLYK
jgi:hypothetical protein